MYNADILVTYAEKLLIFSPRCDRILSRGREVSRAVKKEDRKETTKMSKFKRITSGALTCLILAGMLSTGIWAKSYNDVSADRLYAEQIGILSDIGVIKGTGENTFSPDEPVTREQMALLLFRLMLGKESAGDLNTSSFLDLYDPTYHGAISWANASGYILGTSDSTFEPTAGITLQDAMTMLVRALGHSSTQMNSGYPWTYIDAAVRLGLDDGLEDIRYTKELTRAEVAALLYNALTADYMIPRTASNGMTFYETTTIIERVFGYELEESVIVATNNFALPGVERVSKKGYVTVKGENGFMTVSFDELGLSGTADENLGKSIRLVYKSDDKSKLITVLGSTELGRVESPDKLTFGNNDSYVEIGGVKYQVVEKLSDALSTNQNELLVYAYTSSGELTQITTNSELSALTGAFNASLIFDSKDGETADRLIIKAFAFGQYKLNGGKVNLAGNQKLTDITVTSQNELSSGDYVLYYYNETNKTLEIAAILPVSEVGAVTRLTSTGATIGGVKYELGSSKLGVSASEIHDKLSIGAKVKVVAYNGAIIAIEASSETVYAPSKYLVAESTPVAVYANGRLGYMISANINGVSEEIFVTNKTLETGKVYRYTIDASGSYTLIPASVSDGIISSGSYGFVQSDKNNDEIAFIIESAKDSSITGSGSHHVLASGSSSALTSNGGGSTVSFVTDSDSMIVVKTDNGYQIVSGRFDSSIKINDGAYVAAILSNEVGSVETLRYLYVSDGSLGGVASTSDSVKILAFTGRELIDGKVYTLYSVLELSTGRVVSMMSLESELTVGKNYHTNISGLISKDEAAVNGGIVTGYTKTTVTIDGKTYAVTSDTIISRLNSDNTTGAAVLSELYMKNVELTVSNGTVKSIILLGEPSFDAVYENDRIAISAKEALSGLSSVKLTGISKVTEEQLIELDTKGFGVSCSESNGFELTISIPATSALESGSYLIGFTLDGSSFAAKLLVK